MDLLEEPFFDELRTKQQLGYIVQSGLSPSGGTLVADFTVQGKHRPEKIEQAIEGFLDSFADVLAAMPDEHFEKHRAGLAAAWRERFKTMSECVRLRLCSADARSEAMYLNSELDGGRQDWARCQSRAIPLS